MEGKTYLEILAEQDTESRQEFQINPKELLVEHNVFDQEVDGDDHHDIDGGDGDDDDDIDGDGGDGDDDDNDIDGDGGDGGDDDDNHARLLKYGYNNYMLFIIYIVC
jgi:hypothetical protein